MYQSRTDNYKHQDIALSRMEGKPNFALFCEQGTGKTKIAIDHAGKLFDDEIIDAAIVIAPKGVHYQWHASEIPKHLGLPYYSYCWGIGEDTNVETMLDMSSRFDKMIWLCTTYSALSTVSGWTAIKNFMDTFCFLAIYDESHFVKNPSTQRWKAAKRVSDYMTCMGRLMLSGTPIAKNLMDEWAQFRIMSEDIFEIRTKKRFKQRYCIMGGYMNTDVVGHHSLSDFQKRTQPYLFRARKSGLNLPSKVYSQYHFQMAKDQKKLYEEYKKDLIKRILSGEVERQGAMVDVLRMQQVTNGFIGVNAGGAEGDRPVIRSLFSSEHDNPRLIALKNLLDSRPDDQAIIWCRFVYDVELICRHIDAYGVTGKTSHQQRQSYVKDWFGQRKPYLVATMGTLGIGYNLQEGGCSWAIYYSNRESYVERSQSEDRIHRIGAKEKCLFTDLICDGGRDIAILGNINMKRFLSQYTLHDIAAELEGDVLILEDHKGIKQSAQ